MNLFFNTIFGRYQMVIDRDRRNAIREVPLQTGTSFGTRPRGQNKFCKVGEKDTLSMWVLTWINKHPEFNL